MIEDINRKPHLERRLENAALLKLANQIIEVDQKTGSELPHALGEASTSGCLPCAKLTAVVEPVEGDFSILADLDEVAVRIAHVAAPFPAVIV